MSETSMTTIGAAAPPRAFTRARRALFIAVRSNTVGAVAAVVLIGLIVMVVFGDAIAPHPPNEQDILNRLQPPLWDGGTWSHVFGTDQLGRDLLSRIIGGARLTLLFGVVTAFVEAVIGITLGVTAGYFGGWPDRVIMRWTDIQLGFPIVLLIIFILLMFGSGVITLGIALAMNGWMIFCRQVRIEVRRLKSQGFVEAAVVTGARRRMILARHILPHIRGPIVAIYLIEVPRLMLQEAGLSFLGLGIAPPQITWGQMIGSSRDLIAIAGYLVVLPGLMLVVAVAALYLFAAWIEPWVDPLRRRRR